MSRYCSIYSFKSPATLGDRHDDLPILQIRTLRQGLGNMWKVTPLVLLVGPANPPLFPGLRRGQGEVQTSFLSGHSTPACWALSLSPPLIITPQSAFRH